MSAAGMTVYTAREKDVKTRGLERPQFDKAKREPGYDLPLRGAHLYQREAAQATLLRPFLGGGRAVRVSRCKTQAGGDRTLALLPGSSVYEHCFGAGIAAFLRKIAGGDQLSWVDGNFGQN